MHSQTSGHLILAVFILTTYIQALAVFYVHKSLNFLLKIAQRVIKFSENLVSYCRLHYMLSFYYHISQIFTKNTKIIYFAVIYFKPLTEELQPEHKKQIKGWLYKILGWRIMYVCTCERDIKVIKNFYSNVTEMKKLWNKILICFYRVKFFGEFSILRFSRKIFEKIAVKQFAEYFQVALFCRQERVLHKQVVINFINLLGIQTKVLVFCKQYRLIYVVSERTQIYCAISIIKNCCSDTFLDGGRTGKCACCIIIFAIIFPLATQIFHLQNQLFQGRVVNYLLKTRNRITFRFRISFLLLTNHNNFNVQMSYISQFKYVWIYCVEIALQLVAKWMNIFQLQNMFGVFNYVVDL
eukprot:TRINITY_DN5448_c1_g2_i1.p1 TRINITY_DN5448_c1_g2~~TRINITY_DN5448_c1_g2_i1.p1  ORF type:complete len:353 (+),score=0.09 TRINITY_DN5448_c1_g2_i1:511-1569(+)